MIKNHKCGSILHNNRRARCFMVVGLEDMLLINSKENSDYGIF